MKLNNLSRLAALLVAIMMLGVTSASAATSFSDLTGSVLSSTDQAAEWIKEGYCSTCAPEVVNYGYTEWPTDEYTCLYEQLAAMTAGEAYDFIYALDQSDDYKMAYVYANAHAAHVLAGDAAVICVESSGGCISSGIYTVPGPKHVEGTCPWYQETEYVPTTPVTTDLDVSTPDKLEGVTEVVLSFTATDATTYTWQRSTTPDVTDSWAAIDGATENTYTLSITPKALTYAYRCVATDADGNVVSTSAPLYLGGETFFAWVNSTDIYTWVTAPDLAKTQTVEYILAAYAASADGIALAEAIYVADGDVADTYILLELLGLTTLADIDSEGNVIDTRYHIVVATYNATTDTITALTTSDTTATD